MHEERAAESSMETPALDGVWLRRERERIAIGRRQVADRLGLPESQVIRVEINQRLVPPAWFVALAELGFPVPAAVLPQKAATQAVTVDPINGPASAELPPPVEQASAAEAAGSVAISPAVAAVDQLTMQGASPSLASPDVVSETATEPSIAAPASAAPAFAPSTDPTPAPSAVPLPARGPAESPEMAMPATAPSVEPSLFPSTAASDAIATVALPAVATSPALPPRRSIAATLDSTPLRGRWLRVQRQASDISAKRLCHALAIPKTSLPHLERNDVPIPTGWLPKLAELGLLPAGSSDILAAAPPAAVRYTGRWLRRERKKRGMLHIAIAPALHVACASLEIIEARDWPLPPEWLPILRRLGLPVSEAAAARLAQATPSTEDAPPPRSPPKAKVRRAASSASTSDGKPDGKSESQPLTGAWLRRHRLKRNLMQRELSAHLKTNPSELCRYEMKDRPLRTDWLPVLHKLGFPVPTAPKAKTSPDVSTTSATVSVKAARKKTVQAAVGQVIDGRWLKAERNRLGLSVRAVRLHLHVAAKTYDHFEASRGLVPRFWWPGLRKLGFHLPASLPGSAMPATPLVGPPDGAWLAQERKRLALTEYETCQALRINARNLRRVERESAELPKAWQAKLPLLGIVIDARSARRGQAHKATNAAPPPAVSVQPSKPSKKRETAPTAAATTATAPTAATLEPATTPTLAPIVSEGADLAALIVQYRVSFGRRAKQPAFEILRRILTDLSESGLDGTITDEDVERAAQVLIHRR